MEHELFDYSPIVERPAINWPNGARVAFYVGVNIEEYPAGVPGPGPIPPTIGLDPDPGNAGWRDYAPRVGIWRMMDAMDAAGVRGSVLLNSDVCKVNPQIIEAGNERGWVWLAHGKVNTTLQANMEEDAEREYLEQQVADIESSTGQRPRGWLGPGLTETHNTPRLLAELGFNYVLDWVNDDQPYHFNVPGMASVPYDIDLNDMTAWGTRNMNAWDWERTLLDKLEVLIEDSRSSVMALALHPFIVGHPHRVKYLKSLLRTIADTKEVWVTTSDEIADHFHKEHPAK